MKTIALYNVKGGVGKTTSAINIAHVLSAEHQKKVLIIDLDPQANSSDFFDRNTYKEGHSIENVFRGDIPITDAIYPTAYPNLWIIPSTITLSRVEKEMLSNTTEPQQLKLAAILEDISDQYDFCVLDCSPSAEALININGLAAADLVFIPLKADKWAIRGLQYTMQIINTVRRFNRQLKLGGVFFVQYENRIVNRESLQFVEQEMGAESILNSISKSKFAEETSFGGSPISVYAGSSKIAKEYQDLTNQILDRCN